MRIIRITILNVLLVAMFMSGCVSTKIQTDWKDSNYSGTFRKVLVICLAKEEIVRTTLESDIAAQFTKRGVVAVESNTILASLRDVDREMVRRKVREIDADGVLIVKPVSRETDVYASPEIWSTSYDLQDQLMTVEAYKVQISLYETTKGKVVWQALSETVIGGAWTDTLRKFAEVMGARLIERKLI